jgi:hypothetical protein
MFGVLLFAVGYQRTFKTHTNEEGWPESSAIILQATEGAYFMSQISCRKVSVLVKTFPTFY